MPNFNPKRPRTDDKDYDLFVPRHGKKAMRIPKKVQEVLDVELEDPAEAQRRFKRRSKQGKAMSAKVWNKDKVGIDAKKAMERGFPMTDDRCARAVKAKLNNILARARKNRQRAEQDITAAEVAIAVCDDYITKHRENS